MSRVSTNAGKHRYLRLDLPDLFAHINKGNGIKLDYNIKPKFKNVVSTEYFDSRGKELFFNDTVKYNNLKYVIKYDSKNFYWIISKSGSEFRLKDVANYLN